MLCALLPIRPRHLPLVANSVGDSIQKDKTSKLSLFFSLSHNIREFFSVGYRFETWRFLGHHDSSSLKAVPRPPLRHAPIRDGKSQEAHRWLFSLLSIAIAFFASLILFCCRRGVRHGLHSIPSRYSGFYQSKGAIFSGLVHQDAFLIS